MSGGQAAVRGPLCAGQRARRTGSKPARRPAPSGSGTVPVPAADSGPALSTVIAAGGWSGRRARARSVPGAVRVRSGTVPVPAADLARR
ncbi:hypothetical protein GCM10027091_28580 [Streptomyces daliensis]